MTAPLNSDQNTATTREALRELRDAGAEARRLSWNDPASVRRFVDALRVADAVLATDEGSAMTDQGTEDLVTVTLLRRDWLVVVGAADDFDARVPREQGDGGSCLDVIRAALDETHQRQEDR